MAKYVKKPPVIRTPFKPAYPPSEEQQAIFDKIPEKENLHIEAAPGSGKSTTLKWVMALNKTPNSAILAFGKEIATEIEPQCPTYVDVGTCHSFGRKAIASKYGNFLMLKNDKVKYIIQDNYSRYNPDNFQAAEKGKANSRLYDLVGLIDKMRVNLADEANRDEVLRISDQYNIDIENIDEVCTMLPDIFNKICENPKVIDFTDMLWLPIRLGLEVPKYQMMYLDERQDLNSLMIEYVNRMTTNRIMTVGDSAQSIFGFAGADIHSTERLIGRFPGFELPLATCYRCGTDIVELAAGIYDKIKPFHKNERGLVEHVDKIDYDMADGSMILSRRNASLVRPCFELLKKGRKAIIKGRNIGQGMIRLIDQMKGNDVFDLVDKLTEHRMSRIKALMNRKEPQLSIIENLNDQIDCIIEIISTCSTIDEVKTKITMLFSEETKGITLSSIHRSKGLEADHVTIVDYSRIRLSNDKMSYEEHIQEKNLHFVAVTRAKKRLSLVR